MTYTIKVNGKERIVNQRDVRLFLSSDKKAMLKVWFPEEEIKEYLISSLDPNYDGIRGYFK